MPKISTLANNTMLAFFGKGPGPAQNAGLHKKGFPGKLEKDRQGNLYFQPLVPVGRASSPSIKWDMQDETVPEFRSRRQSCHDINAERWTTAGGAMPMQFEGAADSRCRGGFETRPRSDFPGTGRFETCPHTASCYDFGRLGNSETVSDACPTMK